MKRMTKGILSLCMSVLMLVSCGGSAGDSFVVFTFLGFFPAGSSDCQGAGLTGFSIPLSEATNSEAGGFQGVEIVAGGFQNNLSGQALQVQRVDLRFFIPGADSQPPDAIDALPLVLGPAPSAGGDGDIEGGGGGVDSSLPEGLQTIPNCSVGDFTILPAGVRSWMNLNRGSLPSTPFDLFITVEAVGVTSAGDVLESNSLTLPVVVTDDRVVPPTVGEDGESTGVGTDLNNGEFDPDAIEEEITA